MLVTQAYKFALDPTPAQERAVKARLDQRERVRRAALSEQLPDDEVERLTRSVVVPWTLAAGLDAWSKSRRGERQGARVGFPRFKRRGRARSSS